MNQLPYPYGIEESISYLSYLESLQCISDDFKDTISISKTMINYDVKRALDKISQYQLSDQLMQDITHEFCARALSQLGKGDVAFDVLQVVNFNKNNKL